MSATHDISRGIDELELSENTVASASATPVEFTTEVEASTPKDNNYATGQDPRLRYIKPYWWPYQTYVKERYVHFYNQWVGR